VARGLGGVVGIENHTSFVHAARAGRIQVRATPLTRGRLSQLWEAVCTDDDGRVVAQGQVRLLCLEAGATLAGKPLSRRAGSDNPLLPEGEA
jgi:acyl-coenzyme A thioesterase PaaI-like protein